MDLIADHISHRFGGLDVLDQVSFTVASGEVVAIVGPSGCGKSTLLSILGGLLQPSEGKAELRGAVVDDTLRRTGLSDFRGTYPKQLSGGMRQRVGIARALAVRPAILLMDEPLSALDAQTRELLMDDLIALHGTGDLASLYVTHNLDEAVRLADRIVVLSRRPGRVRAVVALDRPRAERAPGDTMLAREAK